MKFKWQAVLGLTAAMLAPGCFNQPATEPPPDEQQQVIIPLPYDLAWDAVTAVVKQNDFRVQAQDLTNGIIEAAGPRFTLHDADCGKIKSVAGSYAAEPEQNSSSVYNFLVRPRGPEASIVEVRATFNSSVKVPLHPSTDVDCVSHGIQESNILREVLAQAKQTHRPHFAKPIDAPRNPPASVMGTMGTIPSAAEHRPKSSIGKVEEPSEEPPPEMPPRSTGFSLGGRTPTLEHSNLPDLPASPKE